jgi:hypothetical protein
VGNPARDRESDRVDIFVYLLWVAIVLVLVRLI